MKDDLDNKTSELSIDQTAELARRNREYDVALKNTRNTMASKGLSSSSIRNQAEERLSETQTDILESSQRKYDRAERSAKLTESRGMENIGLERASAERITERNRTSLVKGFEQAWGSDKLEKLGSLGGLDFSDYMFGGVSQGTQQQAQVLDEKSRVNVTLQGAGY